MTFGRALTWHLFYEPLLCSWASLEMNHVSACDLLSRNVQKTA